LVCKRKIFQTGFGFYPYPDKVFCSTHGAFNDWFIRESGHNQSSISLPGKLASAKENLKRIYQLCSQNSVSLPGKFFVQHIGAFNDWFIRESGHSQSSISLPGKLATAKENAFISYAVKIQYRYPGKFFVQHMEPSMIDL